MAQLGPKLGATSAQVKRPNTKSSKKSFSQARSTFFWHRRSCALTAMFPMLCLRWTQIDTKLSPKGLKLGHVEHDLDLHVHQHGFNLGSGSIWAQLPPASPIGSNLASTWVQQSTTWAQVGSGQLGRHAETCVFTFMLGRVPPSWAMLVIVGPKLEPSGPSSAQVAPKWSTSWLVFGQGRPSLTPVGFGWSK